MTKLVTTGQDSRRGIESARSRGVSRRRLGKAAAWSAPIIAAAGNVPVMAASPTQPSQPALAVLFDGGGGSNGFFNSAYLNLGRLKGSSAVTLTAPIVVTIQVTGLNEKATDERDFSAGTSHGSLERGAYNKATRTTTLTWTLPAKTDLPVIGTGNSIPDVLFTFRDGASSNGRITNKIVITSVTGGTITSPGPVPVDSSIVRDVGGVSPDGIY